MCLLVYKPRGVSLDKEMLERGSFLNDDGWGFAARTQGGVYVRKGLDFEKDKMIVEGGDETPVIDYIMGMHDYEMVVHFRAASQGSVNEQNAHPIHTGYGDIWLAHNGGIGEFRTERSDVVSDTALFATWIGSALIGRPDLLSRYQRPTRQVLPLQHSKQPTPAYLAPVQTFSTWNVFWDGVQRMLGFNKVAVISPAGIIILNSAKGDLLSSGIWVSNMGWKHTTGGGYCGYGGYVDKPKTELPPKKEETPISQFPRTPVPARKRIVCSKCGYCGCQTCASPTGPLCPKSGQHIVKCPSSPMHENWCRGLHCYTSRGGGVFVCHKCATLH